MHHLLRDPVMFVLVIHCLTLFLSSANDVDHGKDHHPHRIDKVPIEGKRFYLPGMLGSKLPGEAKDQHDQQAWSSPTTTWLACSPTSE